MPNKLAIENRNGKSKISVPNNRQAKASYYKELGRLLALEKVWEVKSANFGRLNARDKDTTTVRLPAKEGYTTLNRKQIYEKALTLYDQNELVRPCINIIATAVFSGGAPDVAGKRKDLIKLASDLMEYNGINFHDFAREAELAGDVFLWFKPDGDKTEIRSLDAANVESVLENNDIRNLKGYKFRLDNEILSPDIVQHLKFNSTSTSQYGKSSLRHLIYWSDVLDTLFEKNWLRGAQYYGNPLLVVVGVPGPFQDAVKNQIEAQLQRAGKSWVLPPDTDVKVPDFSLNFPINDIVGWVFRMISIGSEIPITLLGTADAGSRGSAFFANPRFTLAVKPKREVWRIGLRQFFIKIFKSIGAIKEDEVLGRRDFDLVFPPIFERDLSDLADLVQIYRDRKMISKRTARQFVGIDHSDEEEYMKEEPQEDVIDTPEDPTADVRKLLKKNQKTKPTPDND